MRRGRLLVVLLALAVLGYAATGWVVVAPGEVVVVRRLGRVLPTPYRPGPHWGWPLGLDRCERVRIDEVRRLTVGLEGLPSPDDAPGVGEFLTGDRNLVRACGVIQYRISDPVAFVLRARDRDGLLGRLAEASLSRALSRRPVDEVLRSGRAEIARDAAAELARSVARYGLGISILGVSLTDARPPMEVQADFAAAQAAQSEHDRRLHEARAYEATALPTARASASAKIDQARAQAERAVALAQGRADRFQAMLAEASRSRGLTIRRLYLDALRDLLPRVRRKLVLTADEAIDLSILGAEPQKAPAAPP
ncbi:MAG: protease modulator HflK [Isosphaeraceae bacterium]|nr:protease modulator HflK [Isosphaeraceae bacterium]